MCTALCCMLPVYKRIILFAVLGSAVCKCNFKIFITYINNGIERFTIHIHRKQIEQTVLGIHACAIVIDGEAIVQESIIPELFLNIFIQEMVITKQFRIRNKCNHGTLTLVGGLFRLIVDDFSAFKFHNLRHAFTD